MALFDLVSQYPACALQGAGFDEAGQREVLDRIWSAEDPCRELQLWSQERWLELWPVRESVAHSALDELTLMKGLLSFAVVASQSRKDHRATAGASRQERVTPDRLANKS